MISEKELDIMNKIGNCLLNYPIKVNKEDVEEYFKIIEKLNQKRIKRNTISKEYNKKNYRYYSAMKNFYVNRKKGNEEKANYWLNKAKEIKGGKYD